MINLKQSLLKLSTTSNQEHGLENHTITASANIARDFAKMITALALITLAIRFFSAWRISIREQNDKTVTVL